MKRDAFELMRDISANLSIHKSVLSRAKEESEFISTLLLTISFAFRFARFRDVREHVHNYHAVIAACLILAYEEVSATMDVTIQVSSLLLRSSFPDGTAGSAIFQDRDSRLQRHRRAEKDY
jgi:hypothetical protein